MSQTQIEPDTRTLNARIIDRIQYMDACIAKIDDLIAETLGLGVLGHIEFENYVCEAHGINYHGLFLSDKSQFRYSDKQMGVVKELKTWAQQGGKSLPPVPTRADLGLPRLPKTIQAMNLRARRRGMKI